MSEIVIIVKELQTRLDEAVAEHSGLLARFNKQRTDLGKLRDDGDVKDATIASLEKEKEVLQQAKKKAQEDSKSAQQDLVAVKEEIAATRRDLEEWQKKVQEWGAEKEMLLRREEEKKKEWEKEKKLLTEEKESLARQNTSLKVELGKSKTQINQGDLCKVVVSKLVQTKSFLAWFQKMTVSLIRAGKNIVINQLMARCPSLKLRKKELGWDPNYKARGEKLVQGVILGEKNFKLIKYLQKAEKPLTIKEIEELNEDYDPDMSTDWGNVEEIHEYPDANLPYIMADIPTTPLTTTHTEQAS